MAGLIDGPAQQQPAQAPAQQGGEEQPTPEEQQAFSRVEAAAMELIYGDETKDKIIERLNEGADSPAQVLGETAMMLFAQIDEQSGGKIPETVMLQGAYKVLNLLVELAEVSGVLQVDEAVQREAVDYMLMSAAEMGYISQEDIPALQELIQSMPQEEVQGIVAQRTQQPQQQQVQQPAGGA